MTDEVKKDETSTTAPAADTVEEKKDAESATAGEVDAAASKAPAAEAPKEEAPKEEAKEEVKVPKEFAQFIDAIEKLSVLELHQLVKLMEKKFDVSAQAVAVAGPAAEGDSGDDEKSDFTVELTDSGAQKIAVIKAVKNILGLGLKEAKDLVDGVPSVMKEGVKKEDAEEMKKAIEEAGGKVELK